MTTGSVRGDDGRLRCPWGAAPADYRDYHDNEWGRPVTGTAELFERISLEAFQSGLSWLTILRKREAFRRAFAGFGPADVERLLADAAIVRNRAKILATVANARAVLALDQPLPDLVWSFAPDPASRRRPRTMAEVAATTPESVALARALKAAGLRFVGATTAYALMQAAGLVDDHLADCFVTVTPRASYYE